MIADLVCVDVPLARGLQSVFKKWNLKLHNFDLHAPNSLVTKADVSALPYLYEMVNQISPFFACH